MLCRNGFGKFSGNFQNSFLKEHSWRDVSDFVCCSLKMSRTPFNPFMPGGNDGNDRSYILQFGLSGFFKYLCLLLAPALKD